MQNIFILQCKIIGSTRAGFNYSLSIEFHERVNCNYTPPIKNIHPLQIRGDLLGSVMPQAKIVWLCLEWFNHSNHNRSQIVEQSTVWSPSLFKFREPFHNHRSFTWVGFNICQSTVPNPSSIPHCRGRRSPREWAVAVGYLRQSRAPIPNLAGSFILLKVLFRSF